MAYADQVLGLESGNDPTASNPNSTSAGLGGFINATWLAQFRKNYPDAAKTMSEPEILGLRSDATISKQLTDSYAAENSNYLAQKGLPVTPGTTYLAHFAGPSGAEKVLTADPGASVATILGPAVVKANPFLANMSAGDLKAWADNKMGVNAPPMGAPAVPVISEAPPTVAPQAQPNLPAYSFTPQQQTQQQVASQAPMGPMSLPQIQFAPRRFNIADAHAHIPVPTGFKGFSYFRG